ncbi:MAG: hypothetical protein ABR575_00595 [Actinomycetota bacterium]
MPCARCGMVQSDPVRGAAPWARAVVGGRQILVCPGCQSDDPAWADALDRCPRCDGTRLSVVLGSVVCRGCAHDWPAE